MQDAASSDESDAIEAVACFRMHCVVVSRQNSAVIIGTQSVT
jgi:hypothetical protein